jgi:hypothetical protein
VFVLFFFEQAGANQKQTKKKKKETENKKRINMYGSGKAEKGTYDDVSFDKARDGVEDAFCAVGLLLAPEGETFRKVFVTKNRKKKEREFTQVMDKKRMLSLVRKYQ